MNTAGEVDQLAYAREHGLNMMGETYPEYLFFEEGDLQREDAAKWICSPPMRTQSDNLRLWEGLEGNPSRLFPPITAPSSMMEPNR